MQSSPPSLSSALHEVLPAEVPAPVPAGPPVAPSTAGPFTAPLPKGPPAVFAPDRPMPQWDTVEVERKARTMPARPREIFAALGLVVAADLALWSGKSLGGGGYGIAAFFVAVPILLLAAARARRLTRRLGATVAMFGLIAARCAFEPTVGTVLFGLLGVFALTITMRSRTSFLTEVISSFGATFATIPQRIQAVATGIKKHFGTSREGPRSLGQFFIPAGLVAAFVTLFALANPLVARWLGGLTQVLSMPTPARLLSWAVLLFGAVLLARPALRRSAAREDADTTVETTTGALALARNALIPLNIVFFVYNALDATYLWAGSPPPGVSERQYAHEGAAWLTATLALLTVVVGVMFRGALASDMRAKKTRILAFAWLAQGLVLALGTFRRLLIHITTSGLSNVRILGMFGTGLVVVGLVMVGVKLLRQRSFVWLLRRQLDALVVGLLGFSILPTHLVSARVNVSRVMAHEYQSLVNVEEQAAEAESAAALLPLLDHDDERIRRGVAALLLNERDSIRRIEKAKAGWRDGDYATTRTGHSLEAASGKLTAVLGDVERPDAIQPFEYIRNSAIEGEIAQSEISKVKFAQTRSERLVERFVSAHASRGPTGTLADLYDQNVVVDGIPRSSSDVVSAKYASLGREPSDFACELVSSPTFRPLADRGVERLEVKLVLARKSNNGSTRSDAVLVLERKEAEWRIVEERGVGATRFSP